MTSSPRSAVLSTLYQRYLDDENTARFVHAVSERYTIATLERLAISGSQVLRRAATMALGFLGDARSTVVLTQALRDADCGVRILAENGLRELWCREGDDAQRSRLRVLIRLNLSEQFDEVIEAADALIEAAPELAEPWNQRAIAYYQLQQYVESAEDCRQALRRNPYHFAAAVGLANCYLELNDPHAALEVFRLALEINPDMESVRLQVEFLEQSLEGRVGEE